MPELADPPTEALQAVFDQGHAVGALAREYFAGGVLVEEDYLHGFEALRTTERLVRDEVRCLYEPAFMHDDVLVRVDILFKEPGDAGWALIEVKSSAQPKPEHTTDLAIQTYVLRGAGLPVTSCHLLHLNSSYVYAGGAYDLGQLFTLVDLSGVPSTATATGHCRSSRSLRFPASTMSCCTRSWPTATSRSSRCRSAIPA
jgi:hypothetical protein